MFPISENTSPSLYTVEVLQWASVAMEYCKNIENCKSIPLSEWIDRMLGVLPLLYLKGKQLEEYQTDTCIEGDDEGFDFEDETDVILPIVITEETYEYIRTILENYIGAYDLFLDTQNAQITQSDILISVHLSELLADVYQPLGDLLGIIRERNEEALPYAIKRCRRLWAEYWGENCITLLRALHQMRFGELFESILEDEKSEKEKSV